MNKKGIKTIVGIFRFIKERFVGNKNFAVLRACNLKNSWESIRNFLHKLIALFNTV